MIDDRHQIMSDLLVKDLDLLFNPHFEEHFEEVVKEKLPSYDIDLLRRFGFLYKFSDISDNGLVFEWNGFKCQMEPSTINFTGISPKDTLIFNLIKSDIFESTYLTFYRSKRLELLEL